MTTHQLPYISIILCAYKCKKKIIPTINSILGQTYTNFELIIIDDASNDGTSDVIQNINDHRIKIVINGENIGVVHSRKKGMRLATGKYIAHCDHDDIWNHQKLELQTNAMEANPDVGLCGTEINIVINNKLNYTTKSASYTSNFLKYRLFQSSTFLHSSTMARASVVKKYNINYSADLTFADDWDIYYQYAKVSKIMKLPEPLTDYHLHGQNWSIKATEEMTSNGGVLLHGEINLLTGGNYDQLLVNQYFSILNGGKASPDIQTLLKVGELMHSICEAFCTSYNLTPDELVAIRQNACENWWRAITITGIEKGLSILQIFNSTTSPHWYKPNLFKYMSATIKVLIKYYLSFKFLKKA